MNPERARKILNLKPGDGLEAAQRAFRARVKRLHPDRAGGRRRAAYEEVVAAWRALENEARPRTPMAARPEPVEAIAAVSWLAVKLGESIEIEAPHRRLRVRLPIDARQGDRLRVRGQGAEPDVIVTLHMTARQSFSEALRRFMQDFSEQDVHAPEPAARSAA